MALPTLTTSERKLFHRCQQAWWWKYRMGLNLKGDTADALWFGIGVHIALAAWYQEGIRRGPHPAETFSNWCGEEIREIRASREEWDDLPKYEDALELGVAMLDSYVKEYGHDENWDVIYTEQPFKVRVNWRGADIVNFMSAWDLVFRDLADGQIYLGEHKTASQISTAYLALDPQAGIYWALASQVLRAKGILPSGARINGIQYNFLRKTKGDDRPRDDEGRYLNLDGSVSKRQPLPAFIREVIERQPSELRAELDELADEVEVMEGIRHGDLPVTKNRTWECPRCEFFNMCQLHQHGGEKWREIARSSFTTIDPYARYTKSASE
jgi:Zierdtviridae exonuclease